MTMQSIFERQKTETLEIKAGIANLTEKTSKGKAFNRDLYNNKNTLSMHPMELYCSSIL
jgi:hypothetical protein